MYQEEPQDEEMEELYEPYQRIMGEEAEVNDILDAHRFVNVFSAKAYSYKNKKILKQAHKKHMRAAARIKKVLVKMSEVVHVDTGSEGSHEESHYEDISRRALDTYRLNKRKWAK